MPDLTPATARQFLAELTALSKRMGIALVAVGDGAAIDGMCLIKADPDGKYEYVEAGFSDGSFMFDGIEWVEPRG
jgi:hypothetical protein